MGKLKPMRRNIYSITKLPIYQFLFHFHLRLFRFRVNSVRGVFLLRLLFVFVALFLVGWLFHESLDGESISCVAPTGLPTPVRNFSHHPCLYLYTNALIFI